MLWPLRTKNVGVQPLISNGIFHHRGGDERGIGPGAALSNKRGPTAPLRER